MTQSIKHHWFFPTAALLALWEHEIAGQLSDGAWENTAPHNHWRFWSDIEKSVSPDGQWKFVKVAGAGYPTKRTGYNLLTLIDPKFVDLSERMRAYYVDGLMELGLGRHAEYYVGHDFNQVIKLKESCPWLKEEIEKMQADGTLIDTLTWLANGMGDYQKSHLRKSLAEIKAEMTKILALFY